MTAREEKVGALFVEAFETIESIVARRVRAPRATIEDACGFAWARLVARPDVVDGPRERAIGWVARVAEREAWRLSALEHDVATPDALALLDHRPKRKSLNCAGRVAADPTYDGRQVWGRCWGRCPMCGVGIERTMAASCNPS
jgi:hypothetical protein